MKTHLYLCIVDHSCRCGERWTHSYVRFPFGGTPSPVESLKLPVTQIEVQPARSADHCHRCVGLALDPTKWIRLDVEIPRRPEPQAPARVDINDLLA